jgi:hypothetical protein
METVLLHQPSSDRDRCRTFLFKGKNCIGSGKNEKSAPIAIGVKLRSQLETERADGERIGAELSELKQNFALVTEPSQKLAPDAATILSQLARQAQKIYRNAGVMLRKF